MVLRPRRSYSRDYPCKVLLIDVFKFWNTGNLTKRMNVQYLSPKLTKKVCIVVQKFRRRRMDVQYLSPKLKKDCVSLSHSCVSLYRRIKVLRFLTENFQQYVYFCSQGFPKYPNNISFCKFGKHFSILYPWSYKTDEYSPGTCF